ncbi:MAG: hypothetical protein IMZ44_25455 [Planctomycetes bacterium]|nr:hypothetical protein [Planctomycetota bacterium]
MTGRRSALIRTSLCLALVLFVAGTVRAQAPAAKATAPVLVTSCGQSPGPLKITVFFKQLQVEHEYKAEATAQDIASKKYKSVIIVTGASLKGMGAAGVSIKDELARTAALIAEAKKQGVMLIGSHVEGMERRAQGAAPGDNSDELSIDAVCPKAQLLIVRKDGDEDGRFTTISKTAKIPLILFEKNLELKDVLKNLYGK